MNFLFKKRESVHKPRLTFLTHHKCGSSWLRDLLQSICDLNQLNMFHSHSGTAVPSSTNDVSLLTNASYARVSEHIIGRCIHVIRNPLAIILSAYHSHRATHSTSGWPELDVQRDVLNTVDAAQGMLLTLAFVECAEFYKQTPGPLHALRCWNFDDDRIETLRMEDIVVETGGFVEHVRQAGGFGSLASPDLSAFAFEKLTGRKVGQVDESSHYRSGASDRWRHELPPSVIAYVRGHFRPMLERYYPEALA